MPSSDNCPMNGSPNHRLLWIVRHGQRVDNIDVQWRANGASPRGQWDDPPLSPRGVVQASEVGAALATEPISLVVCSPFTRCVQTAQQILRFRQNALQMAPPPVCIEPGFSESLNACQSPPGFPDIAEILKSFPELPVDAAYRPFIAADQLPTDEWTSFCCFRRVIATLRHILSAHTGNVLIVSHGTPITACHFALTGELNYPGQCTISKYRILWNRKASTPMNGHSHWADRWRNGHGQPVTNGGTTRPLKMMPLPPMGKSVVLVIGGRVKRTAEEMEGEEERKEERMKLLVLNRGTDGEGQGERKELDNCNRLEEALLSMAGAAALCAGFHAECVAAAEASHLSERHGLHDVMLLHCSATDGQQAEEQSLTVCTAH
uniref:Phosphoglycerate mutase family protein n=1 Tax=Globodera pallida TaxID=36090 RepID=A0A183BHI3_GLOPA